VNALHAGTANGEPDRLRNRVNVRLIIQPRGRDPKHVWAQATEPVEQEEVAAVIANYDDDFVSVGKRQAARESGVAEKAGVSELGDDVMPGPRRLEQDRFVIDLHGIPANATAFERTLERRKQPANPVREDQAIDVAQR